MTVSMRVMSAGDGYKYLLKSVAVGDGNRAMATPLTRYYAETGCPPGRWLGSGLAALNSDVVQLERLIGLGIHPVTAEALGASYIVPNPNPAPGAGQGGSAHLDESESETTRIEATGPRAKKRRPVAGYDFTFSVPKSVSVLWGLADAGSQELLVQAHYDAMADVLAFMEREVAVTRVGRNGAAQASVTGVLATDYDHWDSRAGDPQLHTHVVVSNKVCTVADSKWRTLAGRPMHAATVALSELYNGILADHLARLFGIGWDTRDRDHSLAREVEGVSEQIVAEFSAHSSAIEAETDRLIDRYVQQHGHQPSARTISGYASRPCGSAMALRRSMTPRRLAATCSA